MPSGYPVSRRLRAALDGSGAATQDRQAPPMWRSLFAVGLCLFLFASMRAAVDAQRSGTFMGSPDDPAIKYSTAPLNNVIIDVNKRLQDGTIKFSSDGRSGYLL